MSARRGAAGGARTGGGRWPGRGARPPGEQGSIGLELAIIAPLLLAIVALMLCYGRQARVSGLVESAARDAARAATHARTFEEARAQAGAAVDDTLAGAPSSCRSTSGYRIGGDAGFLAGASVTVEVWCNLQFTDVGLPLPTQRLTRTFTSRLDPYRGVR